MSAHRPTRFCAALSASTLAKNALQTMSHNVGHVPGADAARTERDLLDHIDKPARIMGIAVLQSSLCRQPLFI